VNEARDGEIKSNLQQKKEKFLRPDAPAPKGRSRLLWVSIVAIAVVAIALGWWIRQWAGGGANNRAVADQAGSDFRIPLAELNGDRAQFFTYRLPGSKEVKFFAVRSKDGVVHAALDACEVCYAARKGYRQEGEDMICNNCERHFPAHKLNEVTGECNPVPLTRRVDGGYLVISKSDLEKGISYFYF
jgi:uncharacterized membrane protein